MRFAAADHGMGLLNSQLLSHLRGSRGSRNLCTLGNDKLLKCIAVKQLQSTVLALLLVIAPLSHGFFQPLCIERLAIVRPEVKKLDEGRSPVRFSATSAEEGISLKDRRTLVYKAEVLPFGFVHKPVSR